MNIFYKLLIAQNYHIFVDFRKGWKWFHGGRIELHTWFITLSLWICNAKVLLFYGIHKVRMTLGWQSVKNCPKDFTYFLHNNIRQYLKNWRSPILKEILSSRKGVSLNFKTLSRYLRLFSKISQRILLIFCNK